jgi:hypothetical protein
VTGWTGSENTDEIIPALVASLGEMAAVARQHVADAGAYAYKYADLSAVVDAVRPSLREHDLAVTQTATTLDGPGVSVTTTVLHKSGQWLTFAALVLPSGRDAQSIGSAITYARRYALLSIFALATEDDDGAAAGRGASSVARAAVQRHDEPRDVARARATFAELVDLADTAAADDVRALADEHDRRLTVAAFVDDPAWRALVDDRLDQLRMEQSPPSSPRPGATGSRGRADDATLAQIRAAGARLELTDDNLVEFASATLGRELPSLDHLTRSPAAKVLTALLDQLAAADAT